MVNQNGNYGQFRPNYERRWNQGPRPQWQQRDNFNQPRIQGYEQRPRLQWRGQNFQTAEGNANVMRERNDQAGRPGPSYWMKEANKETPPKDRLAITNGKEDKASNYRKALN